MDHNLWINSTNGCSSFICLTIIVANIISSSETTTNTNPTSACFWHSWYILWFSSTFTRLRCWWRMLVTKYVREKSRHQQHILVYYADRRPVTDVTSIVFFFIDRKNLYWIYWTRDSWTGPFKCFILSTNPRFPTPTNLPQIFSGIFRIQISP